MDETYICYQLTKLMRFTENPIMFDVGAHDGASFARFLSDGWRVVAFEPNPFKYPPIEKLSQKSNLLTLCKKAVSDKEEKGLTFYLSDISDGISSLCNFHNSHKEATFKVDSIRLDTYCKNFKIDRINFLKIDTEGYDYFVLKSLDWSTITPEIIECEFENNKTREKLNYTWEDMAEFISNKGYKILISEWYPIVQYGTTHKWKCFKEYGAGSTDVAEDAWGNFIAVRDQNIYDILINSFKDKIS